MENKEIEFKYKAQIELSKFIDFCERRKPVRTLIVSGFDHFYSHPKDSESFYRHRVNTNENQLTFKRKSSQYNNIIRDEYNIDLPLDISKEKIAALCSIHGYEYNTSLFKNCFIFIYEYYTLVYYICYDKEMNQLDKFIEIEMKEDYNWPNEETALNELVLLEKLCKDLDISTNSRINESLFEMYRK